MRLTSKHPESIITQKRQANTMLKLKNIKMNNGIISAEYDPENSGVLGSVSVDIKSGEIVDSKLSEYDKDFPVYLGHAVACLEKLALQNSVPEEKTVMWY